MCFLFDRVKLFFKKQMSQIISKYISFLTSALPNMIDKVLFSGESLEMR